MSRDWRLTVALRLMLAGALLVLAGACVFASFNWRSPQPGTLAFEPGGTIAFGEVLASIGIAQGAFLLFRTPKSPVLAGEFACVFSSLALFLAVASTDGYPPGSIGPAIGIFGMLGGTLGAAGGLLAILGKTPRAADARPTPQGPQSLN